MNYQVQVRINKHTGEIEVFQVVDTGVGRRADHDGQHDEVAESLGALVERRAEIEETVPIAGILVDQATFARDGQEQEEQTPDTPERQEL
ncbi:hypothetical protein ACQP2E_12055 [Actinoplanes sp. CA-015351]|uniref:hypothetical protein n=1 Tax=Actinoplanes sp. CA-015351 TaxID=3239897 RepID=UPI003D998A1F